MKVLNYTATAVFVVLVFYLLVVGEALLLPLIIAITIILSHFPKTRPIAIILSSDGHLRVPLDKSLEGFSFSAAMNPAAKYRLGTGKPRDGADS